MNKTQKNYKISLKKGIRAKDILSIFPILKADKIYFTLVRDFTLITEVAFLKKLKLAAEEAKTKIFFVTQKPYFQQILKRQNFEILDVIPTVKECLCEDSISSILGRVIAQKNRKQNQDFTSKKIVFNPKVVKVEPSFSARKIENLKEEKSIRSFLFFVFLILILGLLGLFFWIAPSTVITIKPKYSVIPVTQNILVKLPNAVNRDENKRLPSVGGIFVETEVSGTETFPSTKKDYELTNARGKLTIFNETNKPKFFIPSRLATDDGLVFRTQENITVPAKKDGKPGQLTVDVIADAFDLKNQPIGSRGNIEAGTELYFPALKADKREIYYAKANRGPLVGGSTLTHYFIGEDDYEKAKPILTETYRVQGIESLQKELEGRNIREKKNYILLNKTHLFKSTLIDYQFDPTLIGTESQTFSVKGTVKVSGLVFDQDAIIKILQSQIESSQGDRKKLLRVDETSIEYRVLDYTHLEDEHWVKLSVSLMGIETLDLAKQNESAIVWQEKLKKEIAGKSKKEAQSILVNHPEIDEVLGIKISPFWNKSIPSVFDQIEFKVKEEEVS